jgi:DUF2959 family protein
MRKLGAVGAALCLASLALAGCESAGHDKADSTATQMGTVRGDIVTLKDKSAAVTAAASNLIEKADTDPKTAFTAFDAELNNFESARSALDDAQKSMKSKETDFFSSWEKQTATITDPDVKQKSIERRTKLQKTIETVDKSVEAALAEAAPLSVTMKNLHIYWSNDLTSGGIKDMKDKVGDANKSAKSIGKKCDDALEAIDKAAPEFRTAKPPPPAAEGDKDKDKDKDKK